MSLPDATLSRQFYRVAFQRFEEAQVLYEAGYYIGAVYLAGYAVECMLKTLILNATPESQHEKVEAEFRGGKAHDYEWLRQRYRQVRAPAIPTEINGSLVYVSTWETSLRYKPGMGDPRDAERFLTEVASILEWGDGRL